VKLIDKKGKIFGIINIFDLTVILILGLLAVGGAYRLKTSRPQVIVESQKAIVKVEISKVRQATVDGIEAGGTLYHYDRGQRFGEIIDKQVENFREVVETSDGKLVLLDVPEKYNVILYVEANATNTTDTIIIGGEQTRIGSQFRFKNKKIAVFGTILDIELTE